MTLVDGHNAMHRLGIRAGSHEDARRALLALVRRVAADARVYFDAREAPPGLPSVTREHGVRVEYCRGREADAAILEQVRGAARPERLLVVTDDREVAGQARQLGARTAGVSAFFGPGRSAEEEPRRSPRDAGGFTAEDFDLPGRIDTTRPPRGLS